MTDTTTPTKSTIPRTRSWGIAIAGATAVISGLAVYANSYGVRAWSDSGASSATYTTAKNLVAAMMLGALFWVAGRQGYRDSPVAERRRHLLRDRIGLVAVGVIGGSLPFLLFFEGLSRATSTQAALVHKSLLLWVALLAVPLLGERLGAMHVAAIGLIVAGQLALAGGVSDLGLGTGELMILAATVLWAVEVVIAKRLLATFEPRTVGVARMAIGVVILFGYLAFTGQVTQLAALTSSDWLLVFGTGLLLSGYVATWYTGLARAQAVDVTAVLVFGAVVTALLRVGITGVAMPSVVGLVLVSGGVGLVMIEVLRGRRSVTS